MADIDILTIIGITMGSIVLLMIIIRIISSIITNPFKAPVITHKIDISRCRNVIYPEKIEEWLIEYHNDGKDIINVQEKFMLSWEDKCQKRLKKSILKSYRTKQYNKVKDCVYDKNYQMFEFCFYRVYSSRGIPTDEKVEKVLTMSKTNMINLCKKLWKIGYETTTRKYNEANQRKLVTEDVKQNIKDRDEYTCQICGISKKFLDDLCSGLGDYLLFEIDHIVSISQQGKSVDSNLQCLCWRCNRAKGGNKTNEDIKRNLTYGIDILKENVRR